MTTFSDLLKQVKKEIRELQPKEVEALAKKNPKTVLIDVREPEEWQAGVVPGAKTVARGFLELEIEEEVPDKETEVVCYCAGGVRSALAARSLGQLGYRHVSSMIGGFNGWKNAGLPIETKKMLNQDQMTRYSRHLTLPEVGEEGQMKLLNSKILLIGAGGLGCPTAIYLAAAGVGTLGIVDFDQVDLTNLQRQILHRESDVGTPKTESARRAISNINSQVRVIPHAVKLTRDNVMEIIKGYDIVVNGCDNFPTRYLLNDACVLAKKPMIDGSIFR
ncbi:MAG: ThiF family adenylyltransferase, partial [Deltaproteobacteria bacterium]|nr:ThiF family adenylyltransferase [Deltaproteobacteria bacterium]